MRPLLSSLSATMLAIIVAMCLATGRPDGTGNDPATKAVFASLRVVPTTSGPPQGPIKETTQEPSAPWSLATAHESLAYRLGESVGSALGAVLVVGAAMMGIQRARRRRVPRRRPVPVAEAAFRPPSTPSRDLGRPLDTMQPRPVGWYADLDHMSEQVYWNGESWTARRRWTGAAWLDVEGSGPT